MNYNNESIEEVYFVCKTLGYGYDIKGSAIRIAYDKLRQFVYLGMINGVFRRNHFVSDDVPTKSFFMREVGKYESGDFSLPTNFREFLTKISLERDVFEAPKGLFFNFPKIDEEISKKPKRLSKTELLSNFVHKLGTIPQYFTSVSNEAFRIERSIYWGVENMINNDPANGLIQTCIGLETILSGGIKRGERDLTDRLKDRIAYLLANGISERAEISTNFSKIYALRSALVHGSKHVLDDEDLGLVKLANEYLKKCILSEVRHLCRDISRPSPAVEHKV